MEEIKINDKLNYVHLISGGLDSSYSLMKLTKSIIKGEKPRFEGSPVFLIMDKRLLMLDLNVAKR
jgi:hypothetical protein